MNRTTVAVVALTALTTTALAETSVLRTLPTEVRKGIERVRADCRATSEYVTKGDEGLITFTVSGRQAVLVDNLNFCGDGNDCHHGVNCATGYTHLVEIYVRDDRAWRKAFSLHVTQPIFLSTEAMPTADGNWTWDNTVFKAMVVKVPADSKECPAITQDSTEWKRRSCDYVVKWDGAKFTWRPL